MYQTEISTENRMAWDASTEAAYWQLREQEARTEIAEITLLEFMDAIAVLYPKTGREMRLAKLSSWPKCIAGTLPTFSPKSAIAILSSVTW
ncbi:hypothetical protein QOT19_23255 [Serratia marcescens]|uniref:hypothetical protein n=1 Tax=Serratia marcescens TaxID=615 RepID=UPI00272FF6A4|nr:hypothetical protein [Serratia marcescens]MDP0522244.1 hypothetical protein [Serratia marcescens]